MDDLLLKMMRLKLAIGKIYWGYMTKKTNMSTIDNYHKDVDHDKIADRGKDDATKRGNWESTSEIHKVSQRYLVAIIAKMMIMTKLSIAAKMTRPKGTIGNRQARLYFFSSSLGKEPCHH